MVAVRQYWQLPQKISPNHCHNNTSELLVLQPTTDKEQSGLNYYNHMSLCGKKYAAEKIQTAYFVGERVLQRTFGHVFVHNTEMISIRTVAPEAVTNCHEPA